MERQLGLPEQTPAEESLTHLCRMNSVPNIDWVGIPGFPEAQSPGEGRQDGIAELIRVRQRAVQFQILHP